MISDVRYFAASETGDESLGEVDNRTLSTMFSYRQSGHTFGVGFQKAWGDTSFAMVNGADTYLFGESLVSTFTAPNERVWIARYDFDFAAAGLPGLTLGLKYVKGDEVDPARSGNIPGCQPAISRAGWQRMGARHRHHLHRTKWPAQERIGTVAQLHESLHLRRQRQRKSSDLSIHLQVLRDIIN